MKYKLEIELNDDGRICISDTHDIPNDYDPSDAKKTFFDYLSIVSMIHHTATSLLQQDDEGKKAVIVSRMLLMSANLNKDNLKELMEPMEGLVSF